jgi:hypothetical protein
MDIAPIVVRGHARFPVPSIRISLGRDESFGSLCVATISTSQTAVDDESRPERDEFSEWFCTFGRHIHGGVIPEYVWLIPCQNLSHLWNGDIPEILIIIAFMGFIPTRVFDELVVKPLSSPRMNPVLSVRVVQTEL